MSQRRLILESAWVQMVIARSEERSVKVLRKEEEGEQGEEEEEEKGTEEGRVKE